MEGPSRLFGCWGAEQERSEWSGPGFGLGEEEEDAGVENTQMGIKD